MSEIQNRKNLKSRGILYVRADKEALDILKQNVSEKGVKLDSFIEFVSKNSAQLLSKFLKQQAG